MIRKLLLMLLCLGSLLAHAEMPVAYKGRIRPADAAARLWLYDFYHAQSLRSQELSAIDFQWLLNLEGHASWDDTPLFWISSASTKEALGLEAKENRFSYSRLRRAFLEHSSIAKKLIIHAFNDAYHNPANRSGAKRLELTSLSPGLWASLHGDTVVLAQAPAGALWQALKPGMELGKLASGDKGTLEELTALWNSLDAFETNGGVDLRMLPGRQSDGEWYSIRALDLQVSNFTVYPDVLFERIRQHYQSRDLVALADALAEGYEALAGKPYRESAGKVLYYPSMGQLKAESWYYRLPLTGVTLALYTIAAIVLALALSLHSSRTGTAGLAIMAVAWIVHTAIIVLRCYILARPPVANMFETVVYVPWIATTLSFVFYRTIRSLAIPLAASLLAVALLAMLQLTQISSGMETLQPVLDSQYWLIIHVLLVVASYGVFLLSGVLGHLYLASLAWRRQALPQLAKAILHTMYLGTAMLIAGTILGGVWAAESWGRFWDWDPKESWAFISCCIYLVCIHAYTFSYVKDVGLAVGSIVGLWAISFTWYGVNYILGTGLHSYGFGSGGEVYYYLFLVADASFVMWSRMKGLTGGEEVKR